MLIVILKYAGKDATEAYNEVHSMSAIRENLSPQSFRGYLDGATVTDEWKTAQAAKNAKREPVPASDKPPLHSIINL